MIPLHVLLARLSACLETVALHLGAENVEAAAVELREAQTQLAEIQKVAR